MSVPSSSYIEGCPSLKLQAKVFKHKLGKHYFETPRRCIYQIYDLLWSRPAPLLEGEGLVICHTTANDRCSNYWVIIRLYRG